MSKLNYKPVPHDHEAFLKKALKRKDFREAYEELSEEYALAREMWLHAPDQVLPKKRLQS